VFRTISWWRAGSVAICLSTLCALVVPATALGEHQHVSAAAASDPQIAGFTSTKGVANEGFGGVIAVSGSLMVDLSFNGSAYVFTDSDGWKQTAQLTTDPVCSPTAANSAAIAGNTIVIGCEELTVNSNADEGAAFVFTYASGAWTQTAELIPNDGAAYDHFGASVGVSGNTIVVGAGYEINAYVFTLVSGAWQQTTELSGPSDGEVAISGTTIVAGAPNDDDFDGSVYVYAYTGGTWQQTADLPDPSSLGGFGADLAFSGNTIVVGMANSALYVFTNGSGGWTGTATLPAPSNVHYADTCLFGCWLATSGSLILTNAVTPYGVSPSVQWDPFVYSGGGSSWTRSAVLQDDDPGGHLGYSLAVSGGTILVGDPYEAVGKNADQGVVAVFGSCEDEAALADASWDVSGCFDEVDSTDYDASGTSAIDGMPVVPSTSSDVVDYSTGGKKGDSLDTSGPTSLALDMSKLSGGASGKLTLTKLLPDLNLKKPVTLPIPKGFSWPGPSLTGSITFTPGKGGTATGVVSGKLPDVLGGGTAKVTIITQTGKGVTSVVATATEGAAGNFFKVKSIELTYKDNTWTVTAVGATATSPPPVLKGTIVYGAKGTITAGSLSLTAGSLASLFRLDAITLSYMANTWTVNATATSAGKTQTLSGQMVYSPSGTLTSASMTIGNVLVAGVLLLKTFSVNYTANKGWGASADLSQGDQAASVSMQFTNDGQLISGSMSASGVTLFQVFKLTQFKISYLAAKDSWDLTLVVAGGKNNSTTSAHLSVVGGEITGANLKFTNIVLLGKVTIESLTLDYSTTDGNAVFSGAASVLLPGTFISGVKGSFTFTNGQFTAGSIELQGNVPLYGGVYLTAIRAHINYLPSEDIGGGVSLSAGPTTSSGRLLGFDGDFDYYFATSAHPDGVYQFTGKLSALNYLLGTATLTVDETGITLLVTFGENGQGFKIGKYVSVNGQIDGHINSSGSSFSARGQVHFVFTYHGASYKVDGELSASNTGMTACASIPSLSKKGNSGFAYEWGGTPVIKIGDCAAGNF
jgi:hypothetical protein